ncbi:indolepyruvate ferredoxin oxidoreductase [Methanoculleus sp. FWC-SCC1]|uniref:Indolepyruvate ferredoxin oxidoreductase n=1 Tax=Methanoculleus frigidifontis TaxID=2584085 RepID=A0ABT8MBI6_9EURY|nr:thiamine pyrophosphate-dependent enzyme [Methanoculleus sp. FWC-SCC1]MDN7025292.1 indolepyruvate ferredoxin oxidoreductase [Methanoculleus sp. FWC-SCC1]
MRGVLALAAALRRSADRFYTVPGYPVSDLASLLDAEIVINEKTALEYALGDSLSGRRACVIVKHVGMNACADPLVNATTQGLCSGVVIVAGDDVDAVASQNAQDSRYYGEIAQIPVLEPDAGTCPAAVEEAFRASEAFSRAALLRITPALLEGEIPWTESVRKDASGQLADPGLTLPGKAVAAGQRTAAVFAWSRGSPLNRIGGGTVGAGAAPGQSRAVTVYPPPADPALLADTHEYGRPFLREHRWCEPPATGGVPERMEMRGYHRTFCRDCPFHPVFAILKERGFRVICDAGCSLLAMNPPYGIGAASYGLGSSIGVAATSTRLALTGDYALLHSGMNALIDVYEKRTPLLCIVLKNNRMGMTGGHPAYDSMTYLTWAKPIVCRADDEAALREALHVPDEPRTVVIEGACPEDGRHETVAY